MGIYSDVQADMKTAYAGDLSDAVKPLVIYYKSPADGLHNPATGEFTPDTKHFFPTTVAGVSYLNGTCRGVLSDEENKDTEGNINFNYKIQSLLILDSELNSYVFDFDNKKYFVTISEIDYEIVRSFKDPADATFDLTIQEVQK